MNDHVAKPIDPDLLFKALTTWIAPGNRMLSAADAPACVAVEAAAVIALPGIDMAAALKGIGGDTVLLYKILASFHHDHQVDALAIRQALAGGDMPLAQRITHTLKGVSGSIRATELQSAATALDAALRESATDRYPELLDALERALASVTDSLADLGEHDVEGSAAGALAGPMDMKIVLPLLDELAGLLRELDPDAEITANALRLQLGAEPAQSLADELVEQLAKFEFDAADQTLALLREMLRVPS
jgi:polar amino acid transport system substrate-binding protein